MKTWMLENKDVQIFFLLPEDSTRQDALAWIDKNTCPQFRECLILKEVK